MTTSHHYYYHLNDRKTLFMLICTKLLTILTCVGIGFFNSLLAETTTNPEPPKIQVVSETPVLDLGDVKLASINWDGLVVLQKQLEGKQAALEAIRADGQITDKEASEIENITEQVKVITAQIEAFVPSNEGALSWPLLTEVTIKITGTTGKNATVVISDVSLVSEAKYGAGLGKLSVATGVIPFSVKFLASKNYGKCKITATLDSNPLITSSCIQTVKGQSQAAALALEKIRFDKLNADIAAAKAKGDIATGIFAAIILGILAIIFGATIIVALAIAALGLAIAAAFSALSGRFDVVTEVNNERDKKNNEYIKSTIPKVP